jgi:hypothetical protein
VTRLPGAFGFACLGLGTAVAFAVLVAVFITGWSVKAIRGCWAVARSFDFRSRVWAPLLGVPRPAPLPQRIPAPTPLTPRPDLEAALASRIRALNTDTDHALGSAPAVEPSPQDIEDLITGVIRETRNAANNR